ncbi:hypothetical protein SAMN05216167_12346 [Spirosoma endophyticum]|uniref:Uncharacterized protein n=1 Tax=Spirosoma endophyticum TaxID=662367 RepID=A0A1I2ETV9_9BACT|nr:hypothetical protein SAMN05216167_12346 [Spirosoma endophyticum]
MLLSEDQYQCVWDQGSFLLSQPVGKSRVSLYALGDFFVEIRYERAKNQITGCRSFCNKVALEPYLSSITITSLFE